MFSVHAYSATVASSTAPTYTNLTPVSDPILTISGSNFYVGALNNLVGAYMIGATADKTKIESPSILNFAPQQVTPVDDAALPTDTLLHTTHPTSPIKLVTNEGINFQTSNFSTSATFDGVGLIALSDGALAPVDGDIRTIRATVTSGGSNDVWVNKALSFDTNLPAGSYNLVGARYENAHGKYFRIVFQGNASVRPGWVCVSDQDASDTPNMRRGKMGVWGNFTNFNPPSIDILDDGSATAGVLYLDVIKTT